MLLRGNTYIYKNNQLIDKQIYDDTHYCHFVWKPHDRLSYARFMSIDSNLRNHFVLPITLSTFQKRVDDYCESHRENHLTRKLCKMTFLKFPDQFLIDDEKIRAIRRFGKKEIITLFTFYFYFTFNLFTSLFQLKIEIIFIRSNII